jgi:hypothetical protein
VANLSLARTVRREGELSIRAAMGASTWTLRPMLLAESLLLCCAGAAIGVIIAQPLVTILARYASRFSVRALDLTVDFSLLWVGVALAIVAAVTEASQKPVPMHPTLADALMHWKNLVPTSSPRTGFLQASAIGVEDRIGVRQSCANTSVLQRNELESRSDSDGIRFGTATRPCCEEWGPSSR